MGGGPSMLRKQVVILAGGRGTRLGEHARAIPKPMVTIGGRPNLEHQILLAKRHGFTSVLFLISHLAHRIEAHFGNGERFGMEISYCAEDPPLGTAGCPRPPGGVVWEAPLPPLSSRFFFLLARSRLLRARAAAPPPPRCFPP